ncbi:MAG TPA: hypothetical protein VLS93_14715 [Anaeromyxobacteraceae bacterium]|nr:hypothetical protein [Anaeromyxobacteraceae bacterium]
MARNAIALTVLVSPWPAAAFSNAPPPDPCWPCEGSSVPLLLPRRTRRRPGP